MTSKSRSMSLPPLSQGRASRLRLLRQRRHREENGLFLAEGIRVVEDLLASSVAVESAIVAPSLEDTERGRALLDRLLGHCPVELASEAGLRALADTETPQGVVAVAAIPHRELPTTLAERALVLLLDAVQDPGNFGTLVRGADAFGAAAVVTLPGTVDPWNAKAVRAAAGASFRVPLFPLPPDQLAAWCAATGLVLWGAETSGKDVAGLEPPARVGLVLGNEGAGLTPAVRELVAERVAIPIRGAAESLNVAMAGTVLMYLLTAAR